MFRRSLLVVCTPLILSLSLPLLAQSQSLSHPRAVALAAESISAITRGAAITDVKLTADVTWIAGSKPEAGTGIFSAKGNSASRVDLSTDSGGERSDIRNSFNGPTGKWINPNGESGKYVFHNCLTDAVWFFPAFSALANISDSRSIVSYVGEETWNGLSVKHLRAMQNGAKDAQRLSTMDFYLDPTSSLPLGSSFKTHPDNNMSAEVLIEIRFADYRLVNGIEVPFRIQRIQNGALLLDATVTGASFNTGISDQTFDTR
jgi:hypothetical protein